MMQQQRLCSSSTASSSQPAHACRVSRSGRRAASAQPAHVGAFSTMAAPRLVSALRSPPMHSLSKHAEDGGGSGVTLLYDAPSNGTAASAEDVQLAARRQTLRLGVPSKGRMAEDTISLFKESALSVYKPNPRQYVAKIPQIPELEVWFQRASDVVRKLRNGDLDLGIVGTDMFMELADGDPNLVVAHEALNFGQCKLALGIPLTGKFANIHTIQQLRDMPDWTAANPLRVVTGYSNIARRFFSEQGFPYVALLSADGALEAAPAMGTADIILDLVSTGVTLRENNLQEIQGGDILQSEGMLVCNRKALLDRPGLLRVVHELIERFDAHLKAERYFSVCANMRGSSAEDVARLLMSEESLKGFQGPTIANVYTMNSSDTEAETHFYAATICVDKKSLYGAIKTLQKLGGSGVLVAPMTYIFDEEPERWHVLLRELGIADGAEHLKRV